MKLYLYKYAIMALAAVGLTACEDSDNPLSSPELLTAEAVSYDAMCQTDTIRFNASGSWEVATDCLWITIIDEAGVGNGSVPIYIQQNDGCVFRKGDIGIRFANNESLTVTVSQGLPDTNGGIEVDLPRTFGLGWGYDYKVDHADTEGIRGQVFDAAALKKYCQGDAVSVDNATSTNLYMVNEHSVENLQSEIGGSVGGSVDLFVASAKVNVEFNKIHTEEKDRQYVWCRDVRAVKSAYFSNSVDLYYGKLVNACTTSDFRNAVSRLTPEKFVQCYGTHLIVSADLGGKLDYYFTLSQNITTETEKVITTITVKVLFFKTSASTVDENTWTEIKKDFKGNMYVAGGGEYAERLNKEFQLHASKCEPITDESLFNDWYSRFQDPKTAVDSELTLVDFQVVPIWTIVELIDKTKADAIEHYVRNTYLSSNNSN